MASEFLRVQNASKAKRTLVNDGPSLVFVPEKQQTKPRFIQDFSRIKPEMMQKVLSSIRLSLDKKVDFAPVNRKANDFDGQCEASGHKKMLELFPIKPRSCVGYNLIVTENKITLPFAIGQTNPRSVPAKAPEQPSITQLTIFYNGAINVYDVSPEKAQGIMKLASANSSRNTRTSTISSSKIEQISKTLPSKPASNTVNENQRQTPPVGLEIARKLCVQSFLRKRKERFNSVAPYTTMKPVTLTSKAEKESDDRIILSLAS